MKVDNKSNLTLGQNRPSYVLQRGISGPSNSPSKCSVRITSKRQYNGGLFVFDVAAMPFGCSVWPGMYYLHLLIHHIPTTSRPTQPCGLSAPTGPTTVRLSLFYLSQSNTNVPIGEIDIIEGVHNSPTNLFTVHTGPNSGCIIDRAPPTAFTSLSRVVNPRCASKDGDNAGCSFIDETPGAYGQGFNDAGGAVIAMLWEDDGIKICTFPRSLSSRVMNS